MRYAHGKPRIFCSADDCMRSRRFSAIRICADDLLSALLYLALTQTRVSTPVRSKIHYFASTNRISPRWISLCCKNRQMMTLILLLFRQIIRLEGNSLCKLFPIFWLSHTPKSSDLRQSWFYCEFYDWLVHYMSMYARTVLLYTRFSAASICSMAFKSAAFRFRNEFGLIHAAVGP